MTDPFDTVREAWQHSRRNPYRVVEYDAALASIEERLRVAEAAHPDSMAGIAALIARAEAAERERDSLMADSWRAFVVSGGDPDGDLKWHCPPVDAGRSLVDAIETLRSDYNEAQDEVRAAEQARKEDPTPPVG